MNILSIILITFQGTLEEWRPIFFIIAGTTAISTVFFIIYGSGDLQDWARDPYIHRPSKVELEEINKENEIEVDTVVADTIP